MFQCVHSSLYVNDNSLNITNLLVGNTDVPLSCESVAQLSNAIINHTTYYQIRLQFGETVMWWLRGLQWFVLVTTFEMFHHFTILAGVCQSLQDHSWWLGHACHLWRVSQHCEGWGARDRRQTAHSASSQKGLDKSIPPSPSTDTSWLSGEDVTFYGHVLWWCHYKYSNKCVS